MTTRNVCSELVFSLSPSKHVRGGGGASVEYEIYPPAACAATHHHKTSHPPRLVFRRYRSH